MRVDFHLDVSFERLEGNDFLDFLDIVEEHSSPNRSRELESANRR